MMRNEKLARWIVVALILMAVAIPVGGLWLKRSNVNVIELHARTPENGGWSMNTIQARVGQPITLQMTSDDVVHGFAVGKSDMLTWVNIIPGETVETTLTFDHPGKYTFYCTRWCGTNHWRMHGEIIVTGDGDPLPADPVPLYLQYHLDIDAPHLAKVIPASPPSAERGARFESMLPAYVTEEQTYLLNSPADLWQRLRQEPALADLSDMDIWDVVRWVWDKQTSAKSQSLGIKMFMALAAAAHGAAGKGDGVMVRGLPEMSHETMGRKLVRPPDFTDPHVLLGASPAILEGKIIRGGMGTGMPSWGAILSREQIRSIIGYLYTIAWDSIK
jgi:plastocyanin